MGGAGGRWIALSAEDLIRVNGFFGGGFRLKEWHFGYSYPLCDHAARENLDGVVESGHRGVVESAGCGELAFDFVVGLHGLDHGLV